MVSPSVFRPKAVPAKFGLQLQLSYYIIMSSSKGPHTAEREEEKRLLPR
jgi:hypothetical protein